MLAPMPLVPEITPYDVAGPLLLHEWDAYYSTFGFATGVSSYGDRRGGKDLTQAVGGTQPSRVAAGLQSYLLGSGTQYLQNTSMSVSGDVTIMFIGNLVSFIGTGQNLLHLGAGLGVIQALNGSAFRGLLTDVTGQDVILGPSQDTSLHIFVLRNVTGSVRKLYVDGGAGVAGVRTQAMNTAGSATLFANSVGGGISNARNYWGGIFSPSVSLAQLNLIASGWGVPRFGATWTTAT